MNTESNTQRSPLNSLLIDRLMVAAKMSLQYKKMIDEAKTEIKRQIYRKKLKKNNTKAAGILALLERDGVKMDKVKELVEQEENIA